MVYMMPSEPHEHQVAYDPSLLTAPAGVGEARQLMALAVHGPLTLQQQNQLISQLKRDLKTVYQVGVTPAKVSLWTGFEFFVCGGGASWWGWDSSKLQYWLRYWEEYTEWREVLWNYVACSCVLYHVCVAVNDWFVVEWSSGCWHREALAELLQAVVTVIAYILKPRNK